MSETYQMYPLVMVHPAWKQSKAVRQPDGDWRGEPDRFAPVQATNADEEAYYASRGYVAQGQADPNAWNATIAAGPVDVYAPQEYPKWVGDKLVSSRAEEEALTPAVVVQAALRKPPGRPRKVMQ